jgi:predicted MFS family arabinose efflux permease
MSLLFMGRSLPKNAWVVVFCPFAAGYFLSFFYRNVNAVISKDLAAEFNLAPSDLGFLTSMYLLAFAAFQLPLGVLLDRYGPRRAVGSLLCIAAAGALTFALARDFATLSIGRALIGLGVSGALMGAIKAFTLWFPLSRLATVNGLFLGIGGLGALSATAPAEALLDTLGWRGLFTLLTVFSACAAIAVLTVVPEKKLPGEGESLRRQIAAFGEIFGSMTFWRIALPFVVSHAAYLALQGLWLAPWLYDVAGQSRAAVANYLFITAVAYAVGAMFFGMMSDRLARFGVSRMMLFKAGLTLTMLMFGLLAAGVHTGLGLLLAVYGFSSISGAIAYAVFTPLFGAAMTGRVNTASNVLMFLSSFLVMWGIGAVLKMYPVVDGRYAAEGYAAAFWILLALQAIVIAWLLPMKDPVKT